MTGVQTCALPICSLVPLEAMASGCPVISTEVGLDFFEDAERLWEYFHTEDFCVSTGLKVLDHWLDADYLLNITNG